MGTAKSTVSRGSNRTAFGTRPCCHGRNRSTQDQVVRETIDRILDQKINYFVSAIRDAHAQGLIDAPDPEAKARALFACYHGVLAQARVQNDLALIREFKRIAMDILGVKTQLASA
jgi:TetR/AcrR family transcriptional regulator, transcriptional repressor for nem operon